MVSLQWMEIECQFTATVYVFSRHTMIEYYDIYIQTSMNVLPTMETVSTHAPTLKGPSYAAAMLDSNLEVMGEAALVS